MILELPESTRLSVCSKGRRMLIPMDRSGPAPRLAASMIPGPPPVITSHPLFAISLPKSTACRYIALPGSHRAEPKTVTLRAPFNRPKTWKAWRSSRIVRARIFRSPRSAPSAARRSTTWRSSSISSSPVTRRLPAFSLSEDIGIALLPGISFRCAGRPADAAAGWRPLEFRLPGRSREKRRQDHGGRRRTGGHQEAGRKRSCALRDEARQRGTRNLPRPEAEGDRRKSGGGPGQPQVVPGGGRHDRRDAPCRQPEQDYGDAEGPRAQGPPGEQVGDRLHGEDDADSPLPPDPVRQGAEKRT